MTDAPSPARRRLFATAALLLPVLLLAGLELTLRLVGYGEDHPLFVEVPGHSDYLVPNPDVGRLYFARSSIVPSPPHDAFLAEKPAGSTRIFVQGGSTGAGFPYAHGAMFSRILEQHLTRTFPNRYIEVVNTSMAAVNSYTLLDFADQIIEQHPDVVLIYAGHNEYYGAFGVASVESPAASPVLVRMLLALDDFRIVQAVRRTLTTIRDGLEPSTDGGHAEGATLMEEMAGKRLVDYGGRLYTLGLEQFRRNIGDLLCRYRDAGIPVFVGTLVSNERDQPPLQSSLAAGTDKSEWTRLRTNAVQSLKQGDTLAALQAFDQLVAFDSTSADAWYDSAHLLDALGRDRQATDRYVRAKDLDPLRFRAPEEMNAIIREIAVTCGASVVDIADAFAAVSPIGIPGNELILEHLHPNVDGYILMADQYYSALRNHSTIADWPAVPPPEMTREDVLVTELDSTLASWHVRRLLNNWPFQERGSTRADTLRIVTPVDSLALDVLRGRSDWPAATAALGAFHERRGHLRAALRAALALVDEQPYRATPYILAANLLVRQQRFSTALQYFAAADEREPSLEARRTAGGLLARAGRYTEAQSWLERALELDPNDRSALFDLGITNAALGQTNQARELIEHLLELEPNSEAAKRVLLRLNSGQQ